MKQLLLSALLIGIFLLTFSSAYLGDYQQNKCVNIKVLSNCSSVDLTLVENSVETWVIDSAMQNIGGQTFNYTFCDTETLGNYNYAWDENCVDCSGGLCGNNFGITPQGDVVDNQSYGTLILIGMALIISLFFYAIVSKLLGSMGLFVTGLGMLFTIPQQGWVGWIFIIGGFLMMIYTVLSPSKGRGNSFKRRIRRRRYR